MVEPVAEPRSPIQSSAKKRVVQLDILRAVAISLVMLHHSGVRPESAGPLAGLLGWAEVIGWVGVDCFFVLSGFLIGGLIFSEIQSSGSLRLRRFLVRRAFKIWPQYIAYLVFFFIIGLACFGRTVAAQLRMMSFAFIHLQNYSKRWESHIWSLAVEEHFYILFPLLVILTLSLRRDRKCPGIPHFVKGTVTVMALVLLGRLLLIRRPYSMKLHYFGTHARLDSLAMGVLLAYASLFYPAVWMALLHRWRELLVAGIVLAFPVLVFAPRASDTFAHSVGFTCLYLAFGCLLIAFLGAGEEASIRRWLDGRLATAIGWVGLNSYGMYLWHEDVAINPMQKWIYPRLTGLPGPVQVVIELTLIFAITIAIGAITAIGIERPFLALRDRVCPSASRAVSNLTAAAPPH
jgi:peptidoglycan/LPS O-acetylase OafA/YrhL